MGKFTYRPGGQVLVLATGSPTLYTDAAMTESVTVGTRLPATDTTYYVPDGPSRLVFQNLDAVTIHDRVDHVYATHAADVRPLPTWEQMAAQLSGPRWDDLRVSLRSASAGAASPTQTTFRQNTGATSTGVMAYAFSKTIDQSLHFDVQLPHNWLTGTGIRPHVHWSPGSSADTGSVRWELEYTWANAVNTPGNTFPVTVSDVVDQAGAGVAYAHQIASFAEIAGTGKRASSVLMCRLARLGNASEDTFDAVAFGLSVDFHIQVSGHGGVTEYAGA